MRTEDRVREIFDGAIAEFVDSRDFQDLVAGGLGREQLRAFIRNFFLPHYQSAHILAFAYALFASDASELIKENLLEEMGEAEGEEAHPDLLLKLARGAGFSDQEIAGLVAASQEQARVFCAQQVPFPTLREMGLAILLETASFEHLLSRHSGTIGRALKEHYGLPPDSLAWFELHGELDVRHAEESLTTLREYAAFHRIEDAHVERIARAVFARSPFSHRYFPTSAAQGRAPGARLARAASITIYRLHIPFREAFRHAQFERSASDAIVVRIRDTEGQVGYGEALPRDYVTGETVDSVARFVERELAPWVFTLASGSQAWETVAAYGAERIWGHARTTDLVNNAAFCAVELALLDLAYRRSGESVSSRLIPVRREVVYSGVVSAEDPSAAAALARRFVDGGIESLKLKVGVGDDMGRLQAVRQAVGERVRLRADANGAWEVEEAVERIAALTSFGIECVEQPVSHAHPDHVRHLGLVRERTSVPIVADESLLTLADARALADAHACDLFNVRVSKNGGLVGALASAEVALHAGIHVQVGAQVGETAILSAAGRHLAAHVGDLAYAEGSFGTWLLSEDLAQEDVRFGLGGVAPALTRPGLGITVDETAFPRLAVDIVEIPA